MTSADKLSADERIHADGCECLPAPSLSFQGMIGRPPNYPCWSPDAAGWARGDFVRPVTRARASGLYCARHGGCACATALRVTWETRTSNLQCSDGVLKIRVPARLRGARSGDFRLSSGKEPATTMLEQLPPLEKSFF